MYSFIHLTLEPKPSLSIKVDNFYVRSFAGKQVFLKVSNTPPLFIPSSPYTLLSSFKQLGRVTEDDMLIAKHLLSKFEIVLILENFSRDLLQLKVKLGWNVNSMGRAKSSVGKKCEFTAAETAQLKALNALDYELYAHAQTMAGDLSKQAAGRIVKHT